MIRVTVWNEYGDRQTANAEIKKAYPDTIHKTIANMLNKTQGLKAVTAVQQDPEFGLSDELLNNTDVLVYWAHAYHDEISDEVAKRVADHVRRGMGVIFLHSAHKAKAFMELMGTSGSLSWREAAEKERIWTVSPAHPIAEGIPESFVLEHEEMYGEPFGIPSPEDVVFIGWFRGGNVFRSGVTFRRENGKIFYFQPGHETYPIYHDPLIQKVIANAVRWAAPVRRVDKLECPKANPLEEL